MRSFRPRSFRARCQNTIRLSVTWLFPGRGRSARPGEPRAAHQFRRFQLEERSAPTGATPTGSTFAGLSLATSTRDMAIYRESGATARFAESTNADMAAALLAQREAIVNVARSAHRESEGSQPATPDNKTEAQAPDPSELTVSPFVNRDFIGFAGAQTRQGLIPLGDGGVGMTHSLIVAAVGSGNVLAGPVVGAGDTPAPLPAATPHLPMVGGGTPAKPRAGPASANRPVQASEFRP